MPRSEKQLLPIVTGPSRPGGFSVPSTNADDLSPIDSDSAGERRVRQAIERASARNSELLAKLAATEGAGTELANIERSLTIHQNELRDQDFIVLRGKVASRERLRIHRTYQRRSLKSLLYTITQRKATFVQRAQEAEKAYHKTLELLAGAERRQRTLEQDIRGLESEKSELEVRTKKHAEAHAEIDELYASIFAGPTPGFPDEDELEAQTELRRGEHNEAASFLATLTKARKLVDRIAKVIETAVLENNRARAELEDSLFGLGDATLWLKWFDRAAERGVQLASSEALLNASTVLPDNAIPRARQTLQQSLEHGHQVARDAVLAEGTFFGPQPDLDQIVTDISARLSDASEAQGELHKVLKQHEAMAKERVSLTSKELETARQALQEIRQSAFEIIAGFGASAPNYNECCNRAATFESEALRCQIIDVSADDDLPPPPVYRQREQGPRAQ